MMSGIECAGLVLAVFPIVVEGIKFYSKGLETSSRLWQYRKHFDRLLKWILYEQHDFETNLEALLKDCLEDQVEELLSRPDGPLWKDPVIHDAIDRRLGKALGRYEDMIFILQKEMDLFKRDLHLDDHLVAQGDERLYKELLKKFKFCIKDQTYEKRLAELRKANEALQRLSKSSAPNPLKRLKATASPKSRVRHYKAVAAQAESLYNMLKSRFCRTCGCTGVHDVNILLSPRHPDVALPSVNQSKMSFNVVFSFDTSVANQHPLPWNWKEAVIETMLDEKDAASQTLPPSLSVPLPPSMAPSKSRSQLMSQSILSKSVAGSIMLGVSTVMAPVSISDAGSKKVAFKSSPNIPSRNLGNAFSASELNLIDDLCHALRENANTREDLTLGVISNSELQNLQVKLARHIIPLQYSNSSLLKLSSLHNLIGRVRPTGSMIPRPVLSKKDRLILGHNFASSLLQLHQTPWLRNGSAWTNDICFVIPEDASADSVSDLLRKPLLSKSFDSVSAFGIPESHTVPTSRYTMSVVRNSSIFSLGKLLLELWYNKPFRSFREGFSISEVNDTTDYRVALGLLEDIYVDAGEAYGDAVRRCIKCEFDQKSDNLSSDAMKEAVYQGVVMELEKNLRYMYGEGVIDGL